MAINTTTNPEPQKDLQTGGNLLGDSLTQKLLDASGVVSSTTSNLEDRLSRAISSTKEATAASAAKVESQFGRELGFAKETAGEALSAGRAAGSGGILNMAALRSFTNTTDKHLKDLAQRKEELILQNDAIGAAKVADLEFKALEFQQQAQQQVFSNLLGIANFGIQSRQEQRLSKQQTFQENKATSDIALEFGLDPTGKTLQEITQLAMVFASEDRKAKLAQDAANLKRTNADTARILNGINPQSVNVTPEVRTKLVMRWNEITKNGTETPQPGSIQDIELANILATFGDNSQEKQKFLNEAAQQVKAGVEKIIESKTPKKEVTIKPLRDKEIRNLFKGSKNLSGQPFNPFFGGRTLNINK